MNQAFLLRILFSCHPEDSSCCYVLRSFTCLRCLLIVKKFEEIPYEPFSTTLDILLTIKVYFLLYIAATKSVAVAKLHVLSLDCHLSGYHGSQVLCARFRYLDAESDISLCWIEGIHNRIFPCYK